MGPVITMVDQVQVMSVLGRTGGDQGSQSNAAFSDGFGWANLDVPMTADESGGATRRMMACESGQKLISKLLVSSGVLVVVASMRILCKTLYVRKYPEDPNPPDMAFPGWEGTCYCCLCASVIILQLDAC